MRNLIFLICFYLGSLSLVMAQTATTNIIKLQEISNANGMVQTGNVRPTADGTGYLITGTWGYEDYARAMVIRTDNNYNPIWTRRFDFPIVTPLGTVQKSTYGIDIQDLGGGNYVLLANINRNVLSNANVFQNLDYGLIRFKVSSMGGTSVQWARSYGGNFNDVAHSLIKTSDGHLLISGYSNPESGLNLPGKARAFLVKTKVTGTMIWNKRYWNGECNTGLIGVIQGMNYRPAVETEGGYVFATICEDFIYISKVNTSGQAIWTKRLKAGNAIGDGFELAGLGGIGGAILSGGTISSIQTLPNGDLAFMGNFAIALIGIIWNNDPGEVGLGGVAAPIGFMFTTSSAGDFKAGQAFYHERYGDQNQPTEMLCQDFTVLSDGQFLVTAGVNQYADTYSPALLKINLAATAIDGAVVQTAALPNDAVRFSNNDNQRGQSQIQLVTKSSDNSAAISFNFGNIVKVSNIENLESFNGCLNKLNNVRSFPIQLALDNGNLTSESMPTASVTVKSVNRTVTKTMVCTGTGFAPNTTEREEIGSVLNSEYSKDWSVDDVKLFPNPNIGDFTIDLGNAPTDFADIQIINSLGQTLHQERVTLNGATSSTHISSNGNLAKGIYFLNILIDSKSKVIKMVVEE